MPENVPAAVSVPFNEYKMPAEITVKAAMAEAVNFKSVLSITYVQSNPLKKARTFSVA